MVEETKQMDDSGRENVFRGMRSGRGPVAEPGETWTEWANRNVTGVIIKNHVLVNTYLSVGMPDPVLGS